MPQNIKVALCLFHLGYNIPENSTTTNTNAARIFFDLQNLNPAGFDI